MASKVKPGAKHPTKPGMVMGTKGRYVSTSTYKKQKVAGAKPPSTPPSKPATKVTATKTAPTKPSTSSTPKVGATKRLQGRMVRWNGKSWTAAGTGPKKPAPTPRKANATPKPPQGNFKAPKIPKATKTAKPKATSTPKATSNLASNLQRAARTTGSAASKFAKNTANSLTAQSFIADKLKPVTDAAAKNIVRGGLKVTGQDTTNFDKTNKGKPVVKSVNGVDFNVTTEAGRRGYKKAITARNQQAQGSKSGRGAGRASFVVKPSSDTKPSSDKPKTKPSSDKPKTKPSSDKPKTKPSSDKPKTKPSSDKPTLKNQAAAKAKAEAERKTAGPKPKRKPSIKEAAYAKDSRNREYDRLRKAGKTKEAEKLGREIAGMKPKKAKETQKRTGGSRIANITLPKKPKKKQSAANKAGYPGNRNY